MQTGVYRKIEGRTGVGQLYEFDCLCRHHTTGEEMVVYIPLRIEPSWAGTVRHCVIARTEFDRKFVYVSEGLPESASKFYRSVVTDQGCKLPPPGWFCTRQPGHEGPCAALPKPV